MNLVDKDALLAAIDKERKILIEQERLGAEHIVVHHARRLVEDAPTIDAIPVDYIKCRMDFAQENGFTEAYDAFAYVLKAWETTGELWEQEAR